MGSSKLKNSIGDCAVTIFKSGEAYWQLEPFNIYPNYLRRMAEWLVQDCVERRILGGVSTLFLNHTTDYLVDPHTVFPGPMRRFLPCINLRMLITKLWSLLKAANTMYLSMQMWNYRGDGEDQHGWNPGNDHPKIGQAILDEVARATMQQPIGTWGRGELDRRRGYVQRALLEQEEGENHPWWDDSAANGARILNLNTTQNWTGSATQWNGVYNHSVDVDRRNDQKDSRRTSWSRLANQNKRHCFVSYDWPLTSRRTPTFITFSS